MYWALDAWLASFAEQFVYTGTMRTINRGYGFAMVRLFIGGCRYGRA